MTTTSPPCVGLWSDKLLLDASSVTSFLICRRRWYIEHVLKRIPASEPASIRFGAALHFALYKQSKGESFTPEDVAQFGLDLGDDHRNTSMLQTALEQYSLLELDLKPITHKGHLLVEVPFALPLTPTIIYCGRIDRIVKLPNGVVAVEDFKTASYNSSLFWKEFEVSIAQIGYCWAASQLFGEEVSANIITAFFTRRSTPGWERKLFIHSSEQLEEWKRLVLDVAERMLRFSQVPVETALVAPANPVACFGYKFGACHYHTVCEMPNGVSRCNVLTGLSFKDNRWSPLDETNIRAETETQT